MINIAIMGLGNIAHRVAKGVVCAKNAQLYAVTSRNIEKAEAFKQQYGAQIAYGTYEEMLQDERIDMVYICTPNYLHKEHIMMCLAQQKHVLCEKPLVSTMEEIEAVFAYAKKQNCFLMEAEKTLFTPLNQTIKNIIEKGTIGKLLYIEGSYGYLLKAEDVPTDFWGYRQEDGGSAFDVGVYPICYANYFAQSSLSTIQVMKKMTPVGYDVFTQSLLEYENGVQASVRSAWNMEMDNQGYLYGDKGYIKTTNFWKNTEAVLVCNGKEERITVSMESDFCGEIEHASTCVEMGLLQSPILGEKESKQIMKVLEIVKK